MLAVRRYRTLLLDSNSLGGTMMRTLLTFVFLATAFSPAADAAATQLSCTASFPMPIAYGNDVTSCNLAQEQNAVFNFQGSAGAQIAIVVKSSWGDGPCIGLYDPTNTELGADACGNSGGSNRPIYVPFWLATLRSRVMIVAAWAATHPSPDVLKRMLSPRVYPEPRDVFVTLFRDATKTATGARAAQVASDHGHIVLRVEPGGARYWVLVLDDATESYRITSVHGPYESKQSKIATGQEKPPVHVDSGQQANGPEIVMVEVSPLLRRSRFLHERTPYRQSADRDSQVAFSFSCCWPPLSRSPGV
jgi:hypothetical protein